MRGKDVHQMEQFSLSPFFLFLFSLSLSSQLFTLFIYYHFPSCSNQTVIRRESERRRRKKETGRKKENGCRQKYLIGSKREHPLTTVNTHNIQSSTPTFLSISSLSLSNFFLSLSPISFSLSSCVQFYFL